jgi:hypothetical protein
MVDQNLADFFVQMTAFLNGQGERDDAFMGLGDSPSTSDRFLWYHNMVRTNPDRLLASIYDIVQVHGGDAAFRKCCKYHRSTHVPNHWDIPRLALGFASSVERVCKDDSEIPPTLSLIADWEELLFRLRTFACEPISDSGLNPSVEVRQYTHDVHGYRKSIRADAAASILEEKQVTYVAYRDEEDGRIRIFVPTLPQLLLIAWAKKEVSAEEFHEVQLPDGFMDTALVALKKKKVVGTKFSGPRL